MFNETQTHRIAHRATIALVKVIDAFPALIAKSEPEEAAAVVADIIKTQLTRPLPEHDPGEALATAIRLAYAPAERDSEPQHSRSPGQ